jgi:hypothetical protein
MSRPTAQDYADLFETDRRGARILEDLILRFTRPAVTEGGIDAVLKTYERLGKRSVVDFIVGQINQASGLPETYSE